MKPSEVFLLMLSENGGRMRGKTLIQKTGFFLNLFMDLGLKYNPHYYGPYSPELDTSIEKAKALGFVREESVGFGITGNKGFEIRRFDYALTPDGEEVVAELKKRYSKECLAIKEHIAAIVEAGNQDYMKLSIAAKSYYILREKGRPMTPAEIAAEAASFRWDITPEDVSDAITCLTKLRVL